MFKNIYLFVLDSVGVGALPDAYKFGDDGANTFAHVAENEDLSRIDLLLKFGMCKFIKSDSEPCAVWGKMQERSAGKDTTTGHWELMGLVLEEPMPVYPNGFPEYIIKEFEKRTGRGVLGNTTASGTEIIARLGEEHMRTGKLIVYTSSDSVFQIAAHEDIVPVDELYNYCRIAREIMCGKDACGRIIARPFKGQAPDFVRTENRRDFSLKPFDKTLLDVLSENGIRTTAVGKIDDIFCGQGITDAVHSHGNKECIDAAEELLQSRREGFIFINLVDFDSLYGHRNDKHGYFEALAYFNERLKNISNSIDDDTCIIITADHGCDPTDISTDHTREYVPVLVYANNIKDADIGVRESFTDMAATIAELFGIKNEFDGKSFAETIINAVKK